MSVRETGDEPIGENDRGPKSELLRRRIAEAERLLERIEDRTGDPESACIRSAVRRWLGLKRRHLAALAASHEHPA